jgi:molecular chaperone GrpE
MKQKKPEKPKEQKPSKPEPEELEELRRKIDQLQKEKDELFGKLQRVAADYENFQKRTQKQVAEAIAYEKEKIIKALLPAMDNLEHTLTNAQSAEDVDVFVEGIRIIYDQMLDILKSHGVEQIKAIGEKFDPALHEAMTQKAQPDKEENIVLEEFQTGYKLNGRVIRPSRVIVNKTLSEQQAARQEEKTDLQQQSTNEYETTDTE